MLLQFILVIILFIAYLKVAYVLVDKLNERDYKAYVKIFIVLLYGFFGSYMIKLILEVVEWAQMLF